MIRATQTGGFSSTLSFLKRVSSKSFLTKLDSFGKRGVDALRAATPKESGETASAWDYKIERTMSSISIVWINTVKAGTAPLAILLQYGHGTRNGGYVEGRDYINPAMKPLFEEMANEAWSSLVGK